VACWLHKVRTHCWASRWSRWRGRRTRMAVPGGTGPVGVWFLGLAAARRRPADVHHAVMAVCMAWMAAMPAMPLMPGPCHGGAGPVAGAAASYFLLARRPSSPRHSVPGRAARYSGRWATAR